MTPQQFEYVQQLFVRLREMSAEEQNSALATEDTIVREEVESLLNSEAECGKFLEQSILSHSIESATALASHATPFFSDHRLPKPPKTIGPYRLLQQIGEGGHGSVFMAEQTEPIVRKVAIKLIKPGMDSKQVLARFHAEQQALALMDHPSIARVLDAGTTENGAPFFVMELVKGIPIHDFCEQNSLDLTERLTLFLQVCEAVHHAHRKGVIHRDLKPSNVLVAMGESEPLAKVIDFGIAKALDNRLTERTLFTEYGQMIGTLEYMSPEQAEMSAVDIDTRSDVYSLGVLLYQLLTGETPISKDQLLSKGMLEISKQIRDTEPVRPSSRITKRQQQTSTVRSSPTPRMERGLMSLPSNDLDWITMKALAKDRRRRYDSALDFGRDVSRYLAGQPVEAHPPSVFYRLAKVTRRHRIAAITSLLVVASSLLGIVGLTVGLQQAVQRGEELRVAKQEAEQSARRLGENMYSELLQSAWRSTKTRDTGRAQELLDACLPEMRGWEWRFANSQNRAEPHAVIRKKGNAAFTSIHRHQDSKLAVCVRDDGEVEIWDTDSDHLLRSLNNVSQVNTAAITADGLQVIVGTSTGKVSSISIEDWTTVDSISLGHGGIYDIDVSPDNDRIVICTGGSYVEVLDRNLNVLQEWRIPSRAASVSIVHGTDRLISVGLDGNIYDVEIGSNEIQASFVSEASLQHVSQIDKNLIAVVSSGAAVKLDVDDLEAAPQQLIRTTGVITALATGERGAVFLGCGDGTLAAWHPNSEQRKTAQFNVAITALEVEHNALLVALSDGRLLRLDPANPNPGWRPIEKRQTVAACMLSSRGSIATLHADGRMNITDMKTSQPNRERSGPSVQAHEVAAWSVATDASETLLATVGEDRRLRCWELPDLELRFESEIDWGVRDVCVSPDGTWIAAAPAPDSKQGGREGTIGIWDAKSGECIRLLHGHENWILKMTATPDGTKLVSSGENRTTRIWDVEKGTAIVISPEGKSPAVQHAIDPSTQTIYLGHRDGWITSWNMQNGESEETWPAFGDALTGLALTKDKRLLATSRSSELLRVLDLKTSKTIAEFDLDFGYLLGFQLSNDEKHLACVSQDRDLLITSE